jgi:hypothetical protein
VKAVPVAVPKAALNPENLKIPGALAEPKEEPKVNPEVELRVIALDEVIAILKSAEVADPSFT